MVLKGLLPLLCCAYAVLGAVLPTPEDYKVKGLEKFGATDDMYAGLMPISWDNNIEGSLFFWLAKHRHSEPGERKKLVVWLNGGPGCSSMIGMMHEHGPFTIESTLSYDPTNSNGDSKEKSVPTGLKYNLKHNPYSWNEVANVLYVEQPIRTGFAPAAKGAGPIASEKQIAEDFRGFLLSFMRVFTEFTDVEFYIAGESYAGFYIPWMAEHIVKQQLVTNADGTTRRDRSDGLNLAGIAIGNGVMDMIFQEPSYAEYAYYHGLIPLGAKLQFDRDWASCLEKIAASGEPITRGSFDECDMMGKVLDAAGLPNEYNTATFVQYMPIIGPGSVFDSFFQDPEIQRMLHVRGHNLPGLNFQPEDKVNQAPDTAAAAADKQHGQDHGEYYEPPHGWSACNDDINESMMADHPTTVVPNLQFLSQAMSPLTPATSTVASGGARRLRSATTSQVGVSARASATASTATASAGAAPSSDASVSSYGADTAVEVDLNDKAEANHAIRVLLYSGEFDLNCNTLGTLHTLEANRWRNKPWSLAERSLWKYGSDIAGEYLTMDDIFSFLIVRNSGHLLPKDLPAIALDLIDRFVNGRTFADVPLPSEQSYLDAGVASVPGGVAAQQQAPAGALLGAGEAMGAGGLALLVVALAVVLAYSWIASRPKAIGDVPHAYTPVPTSASITTATPTYGAVGTAAN